MKLRPLRSARLRLRRYAVRRIVRDHIVAFAAAVAMTRAQMAADAAGDGRVVNALANALFGANENVTYLSYANQLEVLVRADPAARERQRRAAEVLQSRVRGMRVRRALRASVGEKQQLAREGAAVVAACHTRQILAAVNELTQRLERMERKMEGHHPAGPRSSEAAPEARRVVAKKWNRQS